MNFVSLSGTYVCKKLGTHLKRSIARDLEDKYVSYYFVVSPDSDHGHGEADKERSFLQVCGYSVCNEGGEVSNDYLQ